MSSMIPSLPQSERAKLIELLTEQIKTEHQPAEQSAKAPRDKRLPSKPMPATAYEAMNWIADHRREYANQWVALDGDRLIAHGFNHDEVWAAAQADGAFLPMVTFIEDPDHVLQIIWA
ncbi:MAG: hypothetical protein KA368_17620 [Acidobacteria bacterium]|nr:hypothetical protein [Acidobacteriota bacterium]